MKLRDVQVKIIADADPDTVAAAVATFVASINEAEVIELHYALAAGPIHSVAIFYTR